MTFISKYISFMLLFALAWSCLGLGLGMIAHQMNSAEASAHMHECCDTGIADGMQNMVETGSHHTSAPSTIPSVQMVVSLVVFYCLRVFFIYTTDEHTSRLYIKRWDRLLSHLALLFHRLFARGILHPKTW